MQSARSIRYRLPLLICGLVLVVIILYGGIAYREARRAALVAATDRLTEAATELSGIFATLARRMAATALQHGSHPAVQQYLQNPATENETAARAAAGVLTSSLRHAEIWAADGRVLVGAGEPLAPSLALLRSEVLSLMSGADSVVITSLRADAGAVYFAVAARVSSAASGYVIHFRTLAPSDPAERDALQQLIGAGARLYVANADADVWTDLTAPLTPPLDSLTLDGVKVFETDSTAWLARGASIAGTPWMVVIAFPRAPILARAGEVLGRLVLFGGLLLLIAAVSAWALSRSITSPLGELADAAASVSAGEPSRRVQRARQDELGTLARAFNAMVDNVTATQRDLQQKMDALSASESQLRSTQQRLQHVLASSGAVIQLLRVNNGAVKTEWISDNVTRILGYTPAEAQAPGWWQSNVHPDDRERVALRSTPVSLQDGAREYRFRHKNGAYRWLREEHRVTRSATGIEVIGAWIDITEWRRLEEQFRQTQKLEAVGRLAGGIAHDFNNLLTVILGESDIALDGGDENDAVRGSVRQIRGAAERASLLTRRLLTFSRRQLVEATVFDMNDVVRDLGDILRRLIGENLELQTRLHATAPLVNADRSEVEQIIINLVVNARDAMPDGGTLLIETAVVQLDDDYRSTHAEARAGEYVMLAVSDTGTGMTDQVKAHLFEPFFTTKRDGKGTGLGLATCYAIARQFGGHVGVYSELNVGTTVKLYLPLVSAPPTASAPVERSAQRGSETVLLVEDEEAVRNVAARILRGNGYDVMLAENGEAALQLLEQSDLEVDLLFTDVVMPRMGGRVLAERARALRPDLRILFTSGYTDDVILQHQLIQHGIALLQKPYTAESLTAKVREVLNEPLVP